MWVFHLVYAIALSSREQFRAMPSTARLRPRTRGESKRRPEVEVVRPHTLLSLSRAATTPGRAGGAQAAVRPSGRRRCSDGLPENVQILTCRF